jgi:SAM-dependent methyltransferase
MNLTDRQFWLDYWENKEGLIFEVGEGLPLSFIFDGIIKTYKVKNSLEIGGFPGHYSIFLKKKFNIKPALLDYVISTKIIENLFKINNLPDGCIDVIETDLFNLKVNKQYDLVFSNGLIEHFDDTQKIIAKHKEFTKDGGVLFISLPNFRGFNGWLQRKYDYENYSKHFIPCMDLNYLKKICESLNLKNINIRYEGVFMMWLENFKNKKIIFKFFFKITWLSLKLFFKIFPINSKLFSPYIVIIANK